MARHKFEWTLLPAPVFEHEARGFNKIPLDAITSTWISVSSGTDEVDHVSKLVKEGKRPRRGRGEWVSWLSGLRSLRSRHTRRSKDVKLSLLRSKCHFYNIFLFSNFPRY